MFSKYFFIALINSAFFNGQEEILLFIWSNKNDFL